MVNSKKELSLVKKIKSFFKTLGPGVITGASDDDPSGIATYSIAGAKAGYATLWSAFFTFPFMVAVQEMCARIGLVTCHGLAGVLRRHYPKVLLYLTAILMFGACSINIGADLSGMAAATNLILPLPYYKYIYSIIYAGLIVWLLVNFSYRAIAKILKWLTLFLLTYILALFFAKPSWLDILQNTFVPKIEFTKDYLLLLVAILGTTISPYLFFWQASEEMEEEKELMKKNHSKKVIISKNRLRHMREDVTAGMFFSNLVMYFIIATTAATLFKGDIAGIETAEQAALALRPLAGEAAYLLFALGIIGTGLLAIPVLAGTAAYVLAETFGWQEGLNKHFHQAKGFNLTIIISTILGLIINFFSPNPMALLFYAAVIYGIISPFLIALIIHIANNKKIMGRFSNGRLSNGLGIATFILMSLAVIGLFV
jgi:NRAMP (natural resistance-associated macrophage protein)-like metal ion transporter